MAVAAPMPSASVVSTTIGKEGRVASLAARPTPPQSVQGNRAGVHQHAPRFPMVMKVFEQIAGDAFRTFRIYR